MISLIHPSRGRPEKSFNNAKEWIAKAGMPVELILMVDEDDPALNRYQEIYKEFWGVCFCIDDNKSVVQAVNRAAKYAAGNILFYLSDDFVCFDNWAVAVEKEFTGVITPLVLKVDDRLQDFNVRVITCPIMNRQYFELMGYFFQPAYDSMFVDCDLYEMAHRLRYLKPCKHLVFEHHHVSIGKAPDDDTYRRSAAFWNPGKRTFENRKLQGFPI